jgi:DNA polymerase-4
VGPATESALHQLGIRTALDLRNASPQILERDLGKHGLFLQKLARGEDSRTVDPEWNRKSYGSERTFSRDITSLSELESVLRELCIEIAESLQNETKRAKTFTLKVRYSDFSTITRSVTLHRHLDRPEKIDEIARGLMIEKTEAGLRPVRLIGISASQLIQNGDPEQLWLDLPEFK